MDVSCAIVANVSELHISYTYNIPGSTHKQGSSTCNSPIEYIIMTSYQISNGNIGLAAGKLGNATKVILCVSGCLFSGFRCLCVGSDELQVSLRIQKKQVVARRELQLRVFIWSTLF